MAQHELRSERAFYRIGRNHKLLITFTGNPMNSSNPMAKIKNIKDPNPLSDKDQDPVHRDQDRTIARM